MRGNKKRLAHTLKVTGRFLRQQIASSEAVTDPDRIKLYRIPGSSEVKDDDTVFALANILYLVLAPVPVLGTIYKATNEAADVWRDFVEGVPLWQVQVQHAARRSPINGIYSEFATFIERRGLTLRSLERRGIRIVTTNIYFPRRGVFYVAGPESALQNFLYLLDDLFVYLAEKRSQPFTVNIHLHVDVNVARDDLGFKTIFLHEPVASLPLGFFEAPPVFGKRVTTLHLQPETAEKMSVLIDGNTYNFRRRLDAHNVVSGFFVEEGERRYVRVLRGIDVSVGEERQRFLDICGQGVFMNLAMRVTLDLQPEEGSHVAAFIERLRAVPSLHFV